MMLRPLLRPNQNCRNRFTGLANIDFGWSSNTRTQKLYETVPAQQSVCSNRHEKYEKSSITGIYFVVAVALVLPYQKHGIIFQSQSWRIFVARISYGYADRQMTIGVLFENTLTTVCLIASSIYTDTD